MKEIKKMATKTKSKTRTTKSKNKSYLSPKISAALLILIVVVAGVAIVFYSFAGSLLLPYQYSYNEFCPDKNTVINVKTNQITKGMGNDLVAMPVDPKSDCVKNSAEAMAFRLYYITYGKSPDYNTFKDFTQKMAGAKVKPQLLIPNTEYGNVSLNLNREANLENDYDFIRKLYKNAVNRVATTKELNYWYDIAAKNKNIDRADLATLFAESPEAKVNLSGKFAYFILENPTPVKIVPVAVEAQRARAKFAQDQVNRIESINSQIRDIYGLSRNTTNQTVKDELYRQANIKLQESKNILNTINKAAAESAELTAYAKNIDDRSVKQSKKIATSLYNESSATLKRIK